MIWKNAHSGKKIVHTSANFSRKQKFYGSGKDFCRAEEKILQEEESGIILLKRERGNVTGVLKTKTIAY